MRVLCLHGYGTSGQFMKQQLDAFIRQADASYEFVFLDGEHPCKPAKGIEELYDGPTFCFLDAVRPQDIQSALDHLQGFIFEEGPFDGVIGFSQGASLALTYLLQQEATAAISDSDSASSQDVVSAFKWAVFLSAIPAFSPDPSFCADLFIDLNDAERALLHDLASDSQHIPFEALSGQGETAVAFQSLDTLFAGCRAAGIIDSGFDNGLQALTENVAGAELTVPRIMHPELLRADTRIRIPTVHIVGAKDEPELVASSRLMEGVCEVQLVQSLVHGGGHEIPRSAKDVRALGKAVESAIRQSMFEMP